ncbi:MAG: hypothetical protein DHS20C06_00400 [Hyphobacterium sp.]|nr:MAG: hypothetical protein DHS20C06_00400 [Hyphobacterium sp.]
MTDASNLSLLVPDEPDKDPLSLVRDPRFRHDLQIRTPALDLLADRFFPLLEAHREQHSQRGFGHKLRLSYDHALRSILANLLNNSRPEERRSVCYSRAWADYETSIYRSNAPGRDVFTNCLDILASEGLVELTAGEWGPFGEKGKLSTFRLTDVGAKLFQELGVLDSWVPLDLTQPGLVEIKNAKKKKLEFDPETPEIRQILDQLLAINQFLRDADISIDESAKTTRHYGPLITANPALQAYKRIFNNGDLAQNGRFYGPWWLNMKSADRHAIRIDGQPVAGLDFSAFNARILYAQEKQEAPDCPYSPPDLVARADAVGIDWQDLRPGMKELFNRLLNSKGRGSTKDYEDSFALHRITTIDEALNLLTAHNDHIRHRFFSQVGVRISRLESEIALRIMLDGLTDFKAVLSIHDGFFVRQEESDWLLDRMHYHYLSIVGGEPVVEEMW